MTEEGYSQSPVAPAAASIASLASSWASAAGSRVKLTMELALAEAKLAAISLSLMVFLAMLAAAFVMGAWGLVVAGLCQGLMNLGLPLWLSLLLLGALQAAAAILAWRVAMRLSRHLEFSATRRQLSATDGLTRRVA